MKLYDEVDLARERSNSFNRGLAVGAVIIIAMLAVALWAPIPGFGN